MSEAEDQEFDELLEFLKRSRGFDFTAYKRPSLMRRMRKRLEAVSLASFSDYTDYLEVHPEEFGPLFDTLLINVTTFFRDESAWNAIRERIIPQLVSTPSDARPIRVWSAGCASGEEAYTAAMLLAEVLGVERFRERVKIYATDADEDALNQARTATYTARQVQSVPPDLLATYFDEEKGHYTFNRELRRSVIFGRHDLVQDAPISHVSLLICRNTLMYFNAETQARVLARFHFALAESGILFLGKAEMLLARGTQLYRPIDMRCRIFSKIVKEGWRDRLAIMSDANQNQLLGGTGTGPLYPLALEITADPMLILDAGATVVFVNEAARSLLGLGARDVGRPITRQDTPAWPLDIRTLAEQCVSQRRNVALEDLAWPTPGNDTRSFNVRVCPLTDNGEGIVGVLVNLEDTTRVREMERQLHRFRQELETASEELQSTNEELETTNEELQSTVEELETTNEELQSTNEELETMNEELQSTNEELQTMNDELRDRSDELNRANAFLESILSGVPGGVIVVDRNLQVLAWNHRSEDMWGVRTEEVTGQSLVALDIGLPVDQLRQAIRVCLSGEQQVIEQTVVATNRRGRVIQCRVTCTALKGTGTENRGVILVAEEVAGQPESPVNTVTH